jgi:hypothetical protein
MGPSCETKPIFRLRISGTAPGNRHPPSAELSDCGSGTELRPDARPAACRLGPAQADRAKRTQFVPRRRKRGQPGGHETPPPPGTNVRNGPNFRRRRLGRGPRDAGRGVSYKQSQFAADGWGRPSPRPPVLTLPPMGRQTCKTNPIWPVGRGLGGRNVQNEPNSQRHWEGRGRRGERRGANVRNEPNSVANCAKRT